MKIQKKIMIGFFLLTGFIFTCFVVTSLAGKKNNKLNVLLITLDTLRTDRLSCYSREFLETPNIDSLASKGVLFTKAFSHTSTTLPSHTNIMLGTTPLYHGVHENSNFVVLDKYLTLAEYLKEKDYSTGAFIGSYSLDARFGLNQGFDTYDGQYERSQIKRFINIERKADEVVDGALEWLKGRQSPWFLWLHCFDPHDPYEPPEPFKTRYKDRLYDGEVAYLDKVLGRAFQYLKDHNHYQDTIIILTGDHGESLGEHGEKTHGFFAYNSTIRIPLIIYSPGIKPGRIKHLVSHIDLFPTVCDLLKLKKPSFLQGISLLPALKGKKISKRSIYFESLYPYYTRGWAPIRGFINKDDKFIDSPIPELYDLKKDFSETVNLSEKRKIDKYRNKLKTVMKKLSSPESKDAQQRFDRKTVERLQSLGYISTGQSRLKKNFRPRDDVKTLLPFSNKASEALDLVSQGKTSLAINQLKEVITERDDIATAYYNLADIYKKTGRQKDSLAVLRLAMDKVPSSYLIFFSYLDGLIDSGQYDEVIGRFKTKSYRQMEYDPEIWNILGIAYFRKSELDQAVKAYQQSLLLDNHSPVVWSNYGEVLLIQSMTQKDPALFQQAMDKLKKALYIAPEYPFSHLVIGKAYKYSGDLSQAIDHFEKAYSLKPDLDEAHYFLSLCYLEKGEKTKALNLFVEYKKKYYNLLSENLRKKLDELIKNCR